MYHIDLLKKLKVYMIITITIRKCMLQLSDVQGQNEKNKRKIKGFWTVLKLKRLFKLIYISKLSIANY